MGNCAPKKMTAYLTNRRLKAEAAAANDIDRICASLRTQIDRYQLQRDQALRAMAAVQGELSALKTAAKKHRTAVMVDDTAGLLARLQDHEQAYKTANRERLKYERQLWNVIASEQRRKAVDEDDNISALMKKARVADINRLEKVADEAEDHHDNTQEYLTAASVLTAGVISVTDDDAIKYLDGDKEEEEVAAEGRLAASVSALPRPVSSSVALLPARSYVGSDNAVVDLS